MNKFAGVKSKGITFNSRICVEFLNEGSSSEFVRVAPYCDAPQIDSTGAMVVQRFDFEAAKRLVSAFNENAKKLLTKLGFGNAAVPFYNGHPDFANATGDKEDERDMRVYAEAEALEARENGLWAKIKKTPFLDDLKKAIGRLEISPRWVCEKDMEDGTFKPIRLLSFGLVKTGNLVGADFINETFKEKEESKMTKEQEKQLAAMLGLEGEDGTAEAIISSVSTLIKDKEKTMGDATDAKKTAETKNAEAMEEKKRADEETAKRKEREKELANCLIQKAHDEKRIQPSMKEQLEKIFEADFANAKSMLEAMPVLESFSNESKKVAEDVAKKASEDDKEAEMNRETAGKKLAEMANAKLVEMRKEKPSVQFIEAFHCVTSTKEGRALYDAANAKI